MRIADRIKKRIHRRGKEFAIDDIVLVHHKLMKHYGWIPVEEFKKIPIPTMWALMELCQEEDKAEIEWKKTLLKAHGAKVR